MIATNASRLPPPASRLALSSLLLPLCVLGWLWFTLINHLRVEWAVNPQYAYGWAVPFLCLYLLWRRVAQASPSAVQGSRFEVQGSKLDVGCSMLDIPPAPPSPSVLRPPFSAFQLFSISLLCFLYLPTRLIQEANPEWRLVSWALAFEVIGITLLLLSFALNAFHASPVLRSSTAEGGRITHHASRFTFPPSRPPFQLSAFRFSDFVFPICFFLVSVPWPTLIEGPLIQGLMRANVAVTIELLGVLGVPAVQHGNVIEVATGMVGIDDACSGIRSFQAALMLSLFFGELYALSALRRVLCVIAGFALAFGFNLGRTLLLTQVAAAKGIGAVASWHDPAGVTILVACFLCLWLIARAFQKAGSRNRCSSLSARGEGRGEVASPSSAPVQGSGFEVQGSKFDVHPAGVAQASPPASSASVPVGASPVSPVQGSPFDAPNTPLRLDRGEGRGEVSIPCSQDSKFDVLPAPPSSSLSARGEGQGLSRQSDLATADEVASPFPTPVQCSGVDVQGSRFKTPASFSLSAFQCVSIFLLAWLVLVETGTELWYRSHEWRAPTTAAWQLEFPRDNPSFQDVPLSDKTKQFLRYDEGSNGAWQQGSDQRWQAIFFRWNPGRIAVHLAKSHTPEVCLTAAGRELVSQSGLRAVAVHGLQLPFRSYIVKDDTGPLHVFYCLWEDRANTQAFRTTRINYANRLGPVLAGRRNSGQRSLKIAIWGISDQSEADAALARELEELIRITK